MVSTAIMKKHLLLLNRLHKQQLKNELIPTPTKLSKEEITKYFNSYFTQKDNYYIPKLTTQLKLNEEDFKAIAPKKYEKKPVEKKPVEMKKAEATKEDLPQQKEMKAKKIKLPKLEKVKAEKITLERPEMKKAEMMIMKVKKSKKEKKEKMKNNLQIIIAEKKEEPKTPKEQEEEDAYFEEYFKSFQPPQKMLLNKGVNPNERTLKYIEMLEKENKKYEKSILKSENLLKTEKDKRTISSLKSSNESLKERIEKNLKNIEKMNKEIKRGRKFKDIYEEMKGLSNYDFFPYVANLKEIDNGQYYKDFIRYITIQRDKPTTHKRQKINFQVLLDHL